MSALVGIHPHRTDFKIRMLAQKDTETFKMHKTQTEMGQKVPRYPARISVCRQHIKWPSAPDQATPIFFKLCLLSSSYESIDW